MAKGSAEGLEGGKGGERRRRMRRAAGTVRSPDGSGMKMRLSAYKTTKARSV